MASKFEFDFNRVSYQEVKLIDLDAEDDASELAVRELIAKVIVRWPYDESPSADSINAMGLQDFADLQVAFNERMEALFRRDNETK
jgi:hypothetical protein